MLKKWLKILVTGYIIGLFLAWLFYYVVLGMFFSPASLGHDLAFSFDKQWYMNTFFDRINKTSLPSPSNNIEIFDISDDYFTRGNFADVIKRIAEKRPKAIGVDVLFLSEKNHPSEQNQKLLEVMDSLKDSVTIVMSAYLKSDGQILHSYFTERLGLKYGFVNQNGFSDYTPYYKLDKSKPRFSTAIAESAGVCLVEMPDSFFTNYRLKSFSPMTIDSSTNMDYVLDIINENSIVLLGQCSPTDILYTPFTLDYGWRQMYGIENIAYQLSTIMSIDNKNESEFYQPYLRFNTLQNWAVIIMFSFLFYIFVISFTTAFKKTFIKLGEKAKLRFKRKGAINKIVMCLNDVILESIILFLSEYAVVSLIFYITDEYRRVPDLVFFFILVITLAIGYKLSEILFSKNKAI